MHNNYKQFRYFIYRFLTVQLNICNPMINKANLKLKILFQVFESLGPLTLLCLNRTPQNGQPIFRSFYAYIWHWYGRFPLPFMERLQLVFINKIQHAHNFKYDLVARNICNVLIRFTWNRFKVLGRAINYIKNPP